MLRAAAVTRRLRRCAHTLPAASVSPQGYESQLPPGLVASTPSPALFVFMDAVRDNVATMLGHCGGDADRWRPHLKTTKMAPVYRELLVAGVTKFKCATVREATCLLDTAASAEAQADLLVAYPHVEPNLSRLGDLAAAHPSAKLSVLVEDAEGVAAVPDSLGIFIDVNVGMDRTGQPELDEIVDAATVASESGQLRGLHFYDGHLTMADCAERRAQAHECYDRAAAITRAVCAAVSSGAGSSSVEEIVCSI
jgi:D-serine deaminase-like pyridoxal phosphate-dependent protein